jgi:hypothetical protein
LSRVLGRIQSARVEPQAKAVGKPGQIDEDADTTAIVFTQPGSTTEEAPTSCDFRFGSCVDGSVLASVYLTFLRVG